MASLPSRLVHLIARRLLASARNRDPDFVVGGVDRPYLLRWYVTPWRGWFRHVPADQLRWWQRAVLWCARRLPNAYLHCFLRSDDDRALHDHPWLCNCSLVLWGAYTEHTIAAGGIHRRQILRAGALRFRLGRAAHRIELHAGDCWTLFVTGPVVRDWGFHCPERGWVPWQTFTAKDDPGAIGRGCDA